MTNGISQIYHRFPNREACIGYLEEIRWGNGPVCPYCQSQKSTPYRKEHRHHCNNCNTSFSVTVGTVFHKTKLHLQKWFYAIKLLLQEQKKLSIQQLAEELEVNKNTSWYIISRLKQALAEEGELMKKIVESREVMASSNEKSLLKILTNV